ncbi:MAG TPA: ATP-binding protein [Gaiellaceae bacterium]|nr:ATP-binding protein [Gaiellaceae bacterium]
MRSVSLSTRILAASAVLAVLVAGVFALLAHAVWTLDDARAREAHSKDVRASTVVLEKLVIDLETGLRGFILTGNPRLLQPYNRAARELPRRSLELERLVSGNPGQLHRAQRLRAEIFNYIRDYGNQIVNIAPENLAAVQSGDSTEEGKRSTDAIRKQFDALLRAEDTRAAASAASAQTQSHRAIGVGISALLVCALLILLFGLYLARSTAEPVREVASAATNLAAGDFSVRLAEGGPGEVGELTAAFNHMAEELERRGRELQSQNEMLRESEQKKSELIRIVSHELRTPLASIIGFTSVLLNRDVSPEERRTYLEIVDREGKRLSGLLNDFLDAERLDQGHLHLAPELIDVGKVVAEQVRLFEGQSDKHTLDMELRQRPLPVHGDPNRLAQVVGNLLSNAIKYSPEGGTVRVVAEQENGLVRVSVRDEGLGIPEELQQQVFAKFFRGDATASGIPGSGLGLTIARSVVEAHGGRMDFESGRGEGSVFWLELPVAAGG